MELDDNLNKTEGNSNGNLDNGEDVDLPENPDNSGETEEPEEPEEPENPDEPGGEPEGEEWYYRTIPNFYDRVRSSLSASGAITDAIIDYFENAPMAELTIKQRVPDYEELDKVKKLLFETCIVYQTCYKLCPMASSMRISRQKDPSLEIEFADSAADGKPCERFLAMIDDLIAQINEEEQTSFLGFKVTGGSLGINRCCRPPKQGGYIPL